MTDNYTDEFKKTIELLRAPEVDHATHAKLWRQIISHPLRYESLRNLALDTLRNTTGNGRYSRHLCMHYLFESYPEMQEDLADEFALDKDASLKYYLANHLMQFNRQKGMALILDTIPLIEKYDHETYNAIELHLYEKADKETLAEIKRRMSVSGTNEKAYKPFFELVQNKLFDDV